MAWACPDEQNCRSCSSEFSTSCGRCYDGHITPLGQCVVTPKESRVPHCVAYEQDSQGVLACSDCELGFGLAGGRCEPCQTAGCALCSSDSAQCEGCAGDRVLAMFMGSGEISMKCLSQPREDSNCEIVGFVLGVVTECKMCKRGYSQVSITGEFMCVKSEVANCWYLNPNNLQKCRTCHYGYRITKEGTCQWDQEGPEPTQRLDMQMIEERAAALKESPRQNGKTEPMQVVFEIPPTDSPEIVRATLKKPDSKDDKKNLLEAPKEVETEAPATPSGWFSMYTLVALVVGLAVGAALTALVFSKRNCQGNTTTTPIVMEAHN